jgi:hypothetical protein
MGLKSKDVKIVSCFIKRWTGEELHSAFADVNQCVLLSLGVHSRNNR